MIKPETDMSKSTYIFLTGLLLIVLYSCKKDQLLTYNMADSIYFQQGNLQYGNMDSLGLTLAYTDTSVHDSIVYVRVYVTGAPVNTDRPFKVSVDSSSTAILNKHFSLPSAFVVHAGLVVDSFPVTLYKTPDLQDTSVQVVLDMEPSAAFNTNLKWDWDYNNPSDTAMRSLLSYKIVFSDILSQGPWWASIYVYYFGTYSVKKIELLNEYAGMPLAFYMTADNSAAQSAYYAVTMARYLDQQAAAGDTVYEANGTVMTMASSYK